MTRSRRTASLGLAALAAVGAVTLAACEKPTPLVSVVSGRESLNDEAICYARGRGEQVDPRACLSDQARQAGVKALTVQQGGVLGVGVDPAVADTGWNVSIDGQQLFRDTVRGDTYRRVFVPQEFGTRGPSVLQVREIDADNRVRGIWVFSLRVR